MRLAFAVMVSVCLVVQFRVSGPILVIFMTVQTELLMLVYAWVAVAQYFFKSGEHKTLTRLKRLTFHLSLSLQFLLVIFYWVFILFDDFRRIRKIKSPQVQAFEWYSSLMTHMVYGLWIWFTLLTERTNLSPKTFRYLVLYGVSYSIFNFVVTKFRGVPVYPVIDWQGFGSVIYLLLAFGLSFFGFWLSLKVSQNMNRLLHMSK